MGGSDKRTSLQYCLINNRLERSRALLEPNSQGSTLMVGSQPSQQILD
jgi:hypothetical protein